MLQYIHISSVVVSHHGVGNSFSIFQWANVCMIVLLLKPLQPVTERLVYHTIARLFSLFANKLSKPDVPRSTEYVSENIVVACKMNIALHTMSRIIKDDLEMSAYKRVTSLLLTNKIKK